MKITAIGCLKHAVTRRLPAILPAIHSPFALHPQCPYAFIVGISDGTLYATDRSSDGNFFATKQFLRHSQHEKTCFRRAVKVVKHITQARRSPLNQRLFQPVTPADEAFQRFHSGLGMFRLPQSCEHCRHDWHHLYVLFCNRIKHIRIEMTQKTNPFAHDKRDNQRGQAETMIEGKDQKHALIAVNMDVLEQ